MNLHKYQAKTLLTQYGIPTPIGQALFSVRNAVIATESLGGDSWAMKAQVHAGGRGKGTVEEKFRAREAKGVHIVRSPAETGARMPKAPGQ